MQTKFARFHKKSSGYEIGPQRFGEIDAPDHRPTCQHAARFLPFQILLITGNVANQDRGIGSKQGLRYRTVFYILLLTLKNEQSSITQFTSYHVL